MAGLSYICIYLPVHKIISISLMQETQITDLLQPEDIYISPENGLTVKGKEHVKKPGLDGIMDE